MTLPRLCRGWRWLVAGLCACGLAPALLAQADADLRRALDRFTGEWTGEVQVRALDGFVLKSVPATRRYSWEADVQIVETTLRDPAGDYTVDVRQAIRLGRLEATASRPSLPDDRYVGDLTEAGAITWTHAEGNRRDAREQIVERDGESVLETASVEPVRGFGLSGVVRMVGRFQRVPGEAAGEPTAADAARAPELEAAQRALEASEAAQAALTARVADLVREHEAGAARIKTLEADLETARAVARESAAASVDIEARIGAIEREAAHLRDEQATSAQRIVALEADLAAALSARDAAATDLATAQAAAADAAISSQQALSGVNAQVAALEARLDESTRRISGLEEQLSDAERARILAHSARDDALAAAQEKDARLLALQARLAGIERAARQGDDERSGQLRQLQLDNEALARAVETLQTAAAARESELAAQREALAALRQEAQARESARAAMETALADAEAAREAAVIEVASLRAQLAGGSDAVARERAADREALDRLEKRGQEERARIAALERELQAAQEALAARDDEAAGLRTDLATSAAGRREIEARAAEADGAAVSLRERILILETDLTQRQRDNERLAAAGRQLAQERDDLRARVGVLEEQVAVAARAAEVPAVAIAPEEAPSLAASVRDRLIAEVQQMERRVLELESERNAAREQAALLQRQADEARHLRDDTLVRFQGVVAELNALREEKERLARANLSLQSELRGAQQAGRDTGAGAAVAGRPGGVTPATTADGRTADIVVASLQILGVTRGDDGDKAILNGRLFRSGDTVEPELGIVFVRIEESALVFRDRRGREYRRRF